MHDCWPGRLSSCRVARIQVLPGTCQQSPNPQEANSASCPAVSAAAQVEQAPDAAGRAIAVNYWYDMRFDARHAYMQAIERLAQLLGLNEAPQQQQDAGGGVAGAAC